MTYIDPQGNKTQAVSADSKNIPVVNISKQFSLSTVVSMPSMAKTIQSAPLKTSSSNHSSSADFCRFIEVEVLKIIKQLAQKGNTPQERIQAMAKLTLDLIQPGMSLEELYQNAVELDDQYPELAPVVFAVMKEYEEKYEKKALEQVSQLVKSGQYDQAQKMVKKVLQFKIHK